MSRVIIAEGPSLEMNYALRVVLEAPDVQEKGADLPNVYVERREGRNAMGEPNWVDISNTPEALRHAIAVLITIARKS